MTTLEKLQNNLPNLVSLIEKELGFTPKLEVKEKTDRWGNPYYHIGGTENLIDQLGNTLVRTIFTEIRIGFSGGDLTKDKTAVWFNPGLTYEHPSGGSNGTDFIWDGIWFVLETQEWVVGRNLINK